jgi:FtsP/CotA-like multicopper oxidase with cupredoxin domain
MLKRLIFLFMCIGLAIGLSACSSSLSLGSSSTSSSGGMKMGEMHGMSHNASTDLIASDGMNEVKIPQVLHADKIAGTDVYYTIQAQKSASGTMGYNGNLLGPVVLMKNGQTMHITEVNKLGEATSFHWHGLKVPGNVDGGPQDELKAGATKTVSFTVNQPALTAWFHPHAMGTTASQVYNGLAGLIVVSDSKTDALSLPHTFGKDDIPLILQDRKYDGNKLVSYEEAYNADGTTGNRLLVNGTVNPKLTVPKGYVRLRFVNGSNARSLILKLSNHANFQQIASDGGLLDSPVSLKEIALSPGERAEIVVDFAAMHEKSLALVTADGTIVLPIHVNQQATSFTKQIPNQLQSIPAINTTGLKVTKKIALAGMMKMVSINGKQFDMNRIDFKQKVGVPEIWEIDNLTDTMGGMIHPFHIHGTQFRIISINGKSPNPELQGWKDTIALQPGDQVKILVEFDYPGLYMYHCHILEHEENGMMGQIVVTK